MVPLAYGCWEISLNLVSCTSSLSFLSTFSFWIHMVFGCFFSSVPSAFLHLFYASLCCLPWKPLLLLSFWSYRFPSPYWILVYLHKTSIYWWLCYPISLQTFSHRSRFWILQTCTVCPTCTLWRDGNLINISKVFENVIHLFCPIRVWNLNKEKVEYLTLVYKSLSITFLSMTSLIFLSFPFHRLPSTLYVSGHTMFLSSHCSFVLKTTKWFGLNEVV